MRTPTPAQRVRRLRRRITLVFALTSAAGLVAMAVFAVRGDDARWREQLDHTMNADLSWALGLLEADEAGGLDVGVLLDTMGTTCPPLTVFTAEGWSADADADAPEVELSVEHAPDQPCLSVASPDLREVATSAVRVGDVAGADRHASDGAPVRVFALAFYALEEEYEQPQGALVMVSEATAQRADHERFTRSVAAGCAVLVCLSAAVGHMLSGRAVRPALTALSRQETFLADAAHDLRTPAASLRTLAETALRGDTDPTEVLRRSHRLAKSMGDLVDGLLTRARLMTGVVTPDREPLRLDQLVEAVVAEAPTERHRVTVRAQETIVVADPELLRRAVANLLDNALTHGHAPGEGADVLVDVRQDGTVTVEDSGPGLPPQVGDDTLFERFRSGSGSTGLGLSIASWVAHAHGGRLIAARPEHGGARFVLRLPRNG
ncbi:HAMP domain-containing sensor histidine kinase [Streptomyces sp. JJ38]|uniref:sensor histidine kinase n=1 Tax=Streptomyces sp. JJ38 TaxID=2738128 RepID=UPI0027E0754F|nr:HAMP domain-containing sensor histidine kinase [Streptomyces sp. JJ38]